MQLTTLLFAATLTAGSPSAAQQVEQPPAQSPSSSSTSATSSSGGSESSVGDASSLSLPVSLDKIRSALEHPSPDLLKGIDERPHFRLQIQERQKIQELLDTLKFDSGPAVPGGLYGYDQQQRLFPKTDNPRVQPYGAFSQGELLTLGIEGLIEKYIAQRVMHAIGEAARAQAEREAREEVARALADFWAAQAAQKH